MRGEREASAHHGDTEDTETARKLPELWLAVFGGVVGHPLMCYQTQRSTLTGPCNLRVFRG